MSGFAFYNERMKRQLPVLAGIDLRVHEGELVAIVGPSGCGKSTFLGAVDGLVKLTGGEIRVDGKVVTAPGPDRAMVFQQDSLFPWRTVSRNVMYGLELQKRLPKERCANAPRRWSISSGFPGLPSIIPTSCPAACASG